MEENIFYEFHCQHCNDVITLPFHMFNGIEIVHHYYCTCCKKHFWYLIDRDSCIKYINEEYLSDY